MMYKTPFLLAVIVLVALLAACNGTPAPVEFRVEMTEFAFTPETLEVEVGQEVTIHLVNSGALNHEFMVGRDVMEMDGMPNTYGHNLFEGAEPMVMGDETGHDEEADADDHEDDGDDHDDGMEGMDHGFMVMIERGADEQTVTFTVTEDMVGEWEIGCFTDGGSHYNQGMVGTFIVNP